MFFKIITRIVVFFLLLLSIVFLVSAVNVDFKFYRDSYSSFETVQSNITLNLTLTKDLDVSNIVLLRGDNSSISIAKSIVKVNSSFYVIYFDLPNLSNGQYSFGLNNINYIEQGNVKNGNFFSSLNIINSASQIMSIRPAYVFTKVISKQEAPFTLFIKNSGSDVVHINLDKEGDFFKFDTSKMDLAPGDQKSVNIITSLFDRNEPSYNGIVKVNYGSNFYNIHFEVIRTDFVVNTKNSTINNTPKVIVPSIINYEGLSLRTLSDRIITNLSISLNVGDYYPPQQIILNNVVGKDLHNINYLLLGNINSMFNINPNLLNSLSNNNSTVFVFGLNDTYKFINGNYRGFLFFNNSEGIGLKIPIEVNVYGSAPVLLPPESINKTENVITTVIQPPVQNSNSLYIWLIILFVFFLFLILIVYIYKKTSKKKKEFEGFVSKVESRRNY